MGKALKDMLIGVILGDAHIKRTGSDKAFVSFEQSSKKADYLNYLQSLVKEGGLPLMSDNLKEYSRKDSRYNNTNSSLYFRTKSVKELKPHSKGLTLASSGLTILNKKLIANKTKLKIGIRNKMTIKLFIFNYKIHLKKVIVYYLK